MPAQIFISSAVRNGKPQKLGTGDTDYANTLAKALKKNGQDAQYMMKLVDENSIYRHIFKEAKKSKKKPILHILINPPALGSAFSRKGLEKFKKNGGEVVITVVEFVRATMSDRHRLDIINKLDLAKEVIFLDDNDKNQAIAFNKDKSKRKILSSATVISVPATVSIKTKPPEERNGDIISFGMIRGGKGLQEHVLPLAKLIKKSKDPLVNQKKSNNSWQSSNS